MRFVLFCLLYCVCIFSLDFDCILIGSSPFSLFEALYQAQTGHRVLILEEADQCGGAWRSIEMCGVANVDLGCHQVGSNSQLKDFLERYAGCHIVSMDHPDLPFEKENSPNGWYFSHGCHELIDNLLKRIAQTEIVLLTSTRAESASVDVVQKIVTVSTVSASYTAQKLIVTPMTSLNLLPAQPKRKSKHFHLYMLIYDPTPPQFSYRSGGIAGVRRMMNLTHFVDLASTGRQLIVVQTPREEMLAQAPTFLEELKKQKLVDLGAYLLTSQTYIYESEVLHQGIIAQLGAQEIIEILQTGHFNHLTSYIPRWETALLPLSQIK